MTRRVPLLLTFLLCTAFTASALPSAAQAQERRPADQERARTHTAATDHAPAPPAQRRSAEVAQALLYDQTDNTTTSGTNSQFFAPGDEFNAQAADDFTVPAGGWNLNAVEIQGFAQNSDGALVGMPPSSVDIVIYNDCSDGLPCDDSTAADTAFAAYDVAPDFGSGPYSSFFVNLPSTASLDQGTYWISVVPNETFAGYGQWYWFKQGGIEGSEPAYKAPNNTEPDVCNTWALLTDCIGGTPGDFSFALYNATLPAPPPSIAVQPDSLGFSAAVDGADTGSVAVSNAIGAEDLTVSDLSITGPDAGVFSVSGASPPFTVAAGDTTTFDVVFSPDADTTFAATLEITHDDSGADGSVTTVALGGEGIAPVASIDENFDDVTPPALPEGWSSANVNGDDEVWETNDGEASSEPNNVRIYYNSDVATDDWLFTPPLGLEGGTTYRVQFAYAAYSSGYEENLEVSVGGASSPGAMNDDPLFSEEAFTNETFASTERTFTPPSDGTYYVGFHGYSPAGQFGVLVDDVAVDVQPTSPEAVIEPDSIDLGRVYPAQLGFTSEEISISNDGAGTLTVQEPTFTGADPEAFQTELDTSSYPVDLGGSEALGFEVGLSEDLAPGSYTATLEIPYDAGSGTQTESIPLAVRVLNTDYDGPFAGYYYANSTDDAQQNAPAAPEVESLTIPSGNATDVTSQLGDFAMAGPFDIGFDFDYFGESYDAFCIASDGYLVLLDSGESCPSTSSPYTNPIPTASVPNNLIAWHWDDFDVSGLSDTEVAYGQDDDGGLLVSFENVGEFLYGSTNPDAYVSADVKLYDGAGDAEDKVRFQYNDFGSEVDTLDNVTIGLENADGSQGIPYRYGPGGPIDAGAGDTLAVVFGPEPSALPVELADFTAATNEGGVNLSWQTLSEENNRGFEVEMKRTLTAADGSSLPDHANEWQQVGFVESTAPGGTSTEAQTYQLRVPDLEVGDYTFRLRQVDLDGTPTLSDQTVEAHIGIDGKYELTGAYPNPFRQQATFEIAVKEAQDVTVEVYDVLGRRVMEVYDGRLEGGAAQTITVEAAGLASGVYFYRVTGEDFTAAKKMMLVR